MTMDPSQAAEQHVADTEKTAMVRATKQAKSMRLSVAKTLFIPCAAFAAADAWFTIQSFVGFFGSRFIDVLAGVFVGVGLTGVVVVYPLLDNWRDSIGFRIGWGTLVAIDVSTSLAGGVWYGAMGESFFSAIHLDQFRLNGQSALRALGFGLFTVLITLGAVMLGYVMEALSSSKLIRIANQDSDTVKILRQEFDAKFKALEADRAAERAAAEVAIRVLTRSQPFSEKVDDPSKSDVRPVTTKPEKDKDFHAGSSATSASGSSPDSRTHESFSPNPLPNASESIVHTAGSHLGSPKPRTESPADGQSSDSPRAPDEPKAANEQVADGGES